MTNTFYVYTTSSLRPMILQPICNDAVQSCKYCLLWTQSGKYLEGWVDLLQIFNVSELYIIQCLLSDFVLPGMGLFTLVLYHFEINKN